MLGFKREAVAFAVHAFYSLVHLISKPRNRDHFAAALTVAAPIKEVKMDSAQSQRSSNKCKNY